MKLVVNIPAYNEEKEIGATIVRIKKSFEGEFYVSGKGAAITEKLIQVVDDGSSDNTAEVSRKSGADVVISYKPNRRLAYSFKQAVVNSLKLGADFGRPLGYGDCQPVWGNRRQKHSVCPQNFE